MDTNKIDLYCLLSDFKDGVLNEIYHSPADENLQNHLVFAVNNVAKQIIETYNINTPK